MGSMVVTMKIMPESIEADLEKIKTDVKKKITDFVGETEIKFSVEPVAFGLKSISAIFVIDESIESLDDFENDVKKIENVQSAEISDLRRTVG